MGVAGAFPAGSIDERSMMSHATAEPFERAGTDWRLAIAEQRRRPLRIWLWTIAAFTFLVLVIGGITRLTQSGLSIVDWQPLMGVIPPMSEAQWQETFDQYRQYPEYQQLRRGMTLDEFKFIFFWEYLHRLVARLIGVVFLVPFVYFWARGYFNPPLLRRALLLFALGASQGVMGWLMVRSGLVDRPSVSHYRLAAHLSLAFIIFGYAVWLARDLALRVSPPRAFAHARTLLLRGLALVGAVLAVQIVWGAFVAGLKAGFMYNTFPLMVDRLVPAGLLGFEPALLNFVQNPLTVQWLHRVIGTVLLIVTLGFFLRVQRADVDALSRRLNAAFAGMMAGQYLLGVATLLLAVPVALGVMHQAAAMLIFGVWLIWLHHARQLEPHSDAVTPGRPAAARQVAEGLPAQG
jgi:heme a synthase